MKNPLSWLDLVGNYLSYRRDLGFELVAEEKLLHQFAQFATKHGDLQTRLTVPLAVQWARASKLQKPITWARRIEALRGFATYLRRFDADTEIPPRGLFGPSHRRLVPHIYTEQEVVRLLAQSEHLSPLDGLRPATCQTVFGLLASTGLRISEALNLMRSDFDRDLRVLHIREAKFHKERLVPLHCSVTKALQSYEKLRDSIIRKPHSDHLFLFDNGRVPSGGEINYALRSVCRVLGWLPRGDYRNHRLHDLRHTYIVRSVLRSYQRGIDADKAVMALSTYVGHAKVADTYWYFTGVPELMSIASERFQSFLREDEE